MHGWRDNNGMDLKYESMVNSWETSWKLQIKTIVKYNFT